MNSASLKRFIDKRLQGLMCWEISRTEDRQNGIRFVRVVTQAAWFKSRIYAYFPLLVVDKHEYQNSQFFKSFTVYDDKSEEDEKVTLYKFIQLPCESHWSKQAAGTRPIKCDLNHCQQIIKKQNPWLQALTKVTYNKQWVPQLEHYPKNLENECTPQMIVELAKSEGISPDAYQLEGVKDANSLNEHTRECCSQEFMPNNIAIADKGYIAYSSITKLTFKQVSFSIHFVVAYWIKDTKGNEYKYPKGHCADALFLIADQQRIRLSDSKHYIKDMIGSIFSCDLLRTRKLYGAVRENLLHSLYRQDTHEDRDESWVKNNCQVGDMLYLKIADQPWKAAVYIGDGEVLKANPTHSNSLLQIRMSQFFEGMIHHKIVVRRLHFKGFTRTNVLSAKDHVVFQKPPYIDDWYKNGLHLPFELLTGRLKNCTDELKQQLYKPNLGLSIHE